MTNKLKDLYLDMDSHTDGWNWYWLSYGEKCYAYAVVTAFPVDENAKEPKAGGYLEPHPDKERLWLAEDGTEMTVDDHITNIERQNGHVICKFIAGAFADAKHRFED